MLHVVLAAMSVNEVLGWCMQLLDELGLTPFILAGAIIAIAIALYAKFFKS